MFESDQHDFDEEYEGYRHAAPASPPAPLPVAVPVAQAAARPAATGSQSAPSSESSSAVAVLEPPAQEAPEAQKEEAAQEEPEDYVDPAEKKPEPPGRKKPNLVLIGAAAAIVAVAILVMLTYKPRQNVPLPGDLGPGIFAVSGLRGHLETRWDGDIKTGRVSYQLRIEPMEDRWGPGFSKVTLNPPMPMSVNVRLLDSTGFALCGKEIDFRFDPQSAAAAVAVSLPGLENGKKLSLADRNAAMQAARQSQIAQMQAQETAREHGKDIFQNQTTSDGQVSAVNVQGTLPCSPDQYRRVDYWDFNTNFPTLQEQADLLDPKAAALARKQLAEEAHSGKRTLSKLPQQGFVMHGDDRVTGYDSAHGLLLAETRTFQVDRRTGQVTANAWASSYSLIHYRCDQHANCALTAAGDAAVLHARLAE